MNLRKACAAEFIGTAALLIIIVGSGMMAEPLAAGNEALALLASSLATGAGLFALIETFAPISGAHFNPLVSAAQWGRKEISARGFFLYLLAQLTGAMSGVLMTHLMFGQRLWQLAEKKRSSFGLVFSESLASFGLLLVIHLVARKKPEKVAAAVALYITAAYWCTSSTSFANPAVTLGRCFTDSFTGILWTGAPAFFGAQILGAVLAGLTGSWLLRES